MQSLEDMPDMLAMGTLEMLDDSEVSDALRTIVSLCRESNVDISDLLNNHKDKIDNADK